MMATAAGLTAKTAPGQPNTSSPASGASDVNTYVRPQQPPAVMSTRTEPPTATIWLSAVSLTRNGGNTVSSDTTHA